MTKLLNLIYQMINGNSNRYAVKYARRPRLDRYYWQQKH